MSYLITIRTGGFHGRRLGHDPRRMRVERRGCISTTSGRSVEELARLPVSVKGIHLGRVADILVDGQDDRVVGFELRCGDGERRFLPFAVADLGSDEISVSSALVLLDEPGLAYYLERARRLSELGLVAPCVDAEGRLIAARTAA